MSRRLAVTSILILLGLFFASPPTTAQETTPPAAAQSAAPADAAVDDAVLALQVKTALLDKLGWAATPIEVIARTGTVWLTGKVASRSTIDASEAIVKAMPDVKELHNVVVLEGGDDKNKVTKAVQHAQHEVDDAVLESRVKMHLLQEIGSVGFSVEVEATGGVVTLSGHVPDDLRHKLAVQVAGKVSGVQKLVDLLVEKP